MNKIFEYPLFTKFFDIVYKSILSHQIQLLRPAFASGGTFKNPLRLYPDSLYHNQNTNLKDKLSFNILNQNTAYLPQDRPESEFDDEEIFTDEEIDEMELSSTGKPFYFTPYGKKKNIGDSSSSGENERNFSNAISRIFQETYISSDNNYFITTKISEMINSNIPSDEEIFTNESSTDKDEQINYKAYFIIMVMLNIITSIINLLLF